MNPGRPIKHSVWYSAINSCNDSVHRSVKDSVEDSIHNSVRGFFIWDSVKWRIRNVIWNKNRGMK